MPIVTIKTTARMDTERKKSMTRETMRIIHETVGAPLANIRVFMESYSADDFMGEADNAAVIQVEWVAGKQKEQKKSMIEELTKTMVEKGGINISNVIVLIHEIPLSDVGVAGVPRG